MSIVYDAGRYGISIAGRFHRRLFCDRNRQREQLFDEIYKFSPSEIICNEALYVAGFSWKI